MPEPTECDNGEVQPDPTQPAGGTPEHRDDGHRIDRHNRPIAPLAPNPSPESTDD